MRWVWGLIFGPKISVRVSPTVGRRCDISSELCCPGPKLWRWYPPLVTRFRVSREYNEDYAVSHHLNREYAPHLACSNLLLTASYAGHYNNTAVSLLEKSHTLVSELLTPVWTETRKTVNEFEIWSFSWLWLSKCMANAFRHYMHSGLALVAFRYCNMRVRFPTVLMHYTFYWATPCSTHYVS